MKYGSVCSGIEAASVAWEPLGWEPVFFSEIDEFPSAVLNFRYPNVPCHGDFTTINRDSYAAIDVLVGGTPCVDFSLAGLRAGLDGSNGNLSLEFGRLLGRLRPQWFVWENVPGVFSSNEGRDFAGILGMFTGRSLAVPAEGWRNSGVIQGIPSAYSIAYRVLDAQFAGVPQRRRRVFVVGCLGADWRRPLAVLLERQSLSGDSPPSRKKGKDITPCFDAISPSNDQQHEQVAFDVTGSPSAIRVSNVGDTRMADGPRRNQGGVCIVGWPPEIAPTLDAHFGEKQGLDNQHIDGGAGLFVPIVVKTSDTGSNGSNFSQDGIAYTLDTVNGQAIVQKPIAFTQNTRDEVRDLNDIAGCLGANEGMKQRTYLAYGVDEECNANEELFGPLLRGGEGGTRQTVVQCIGFDSEFNSREELAGPLTTNTSGDKGMVFLTGSYVRRLTPKEASRLQGFPDDWSKIPWKNKPAGECPDGPQYKTYGNSMAVPVMSWIGKRIQMVHELINRG